MDATCTIIDTASHAGIENVYLNKVLLTIARSLNADGIPSSTGEKWGATSIEKAENLRNLLAESSTAE